MRVIFMGTPDFAVGTLEEIIKAGHEVVLVVTQPDKPKGRGGNMSFPPVKEVALEHGIEVFQPKRVRNPECVEYLKGFEPDMIVVAAFGQILPKEIIDMPKYCCINVHASLLPKYRGAAPIQWSVINGDEKSGVTIMRMDVGLDTGDMIEKEEVVIEEDETGGSLFDKLAVVGAKLCVKTMEKIEKGEAVFTKQNDEEATHVGMISKTMGEIDFTKSAKEIECLIRGLNPWPSAYTHIAGKTLKIWKAAVLKENTSFKPGQVCFVDKNSLHIQTGEGVLDVLEVQLEGKKRMTTDAFLRGFKVEEGDL
ncbi:MAG: methionyl-tRNA formyltransferase [Lachnospiraceae bacterium]|nr:methionyl-tRNA formyltransferase [Lachnospiraceae bacterium]